VSVKRALAQGRGVCVDRSFAHAHTPIRSVLPFPIILLAFRESRAAALVSCGKTLVQLSRSAQASAALPDDCSQCVHAIGIWRASEASSSLPYLLCRTARQGIESLRLRTLADADVRVGRTLICLVADSELFGEALQREGHTAVEFAVNELAVFDDEERDVLRKVRPMRSHAIRSWISD
jgi:hypothetical protein